MAGIVGNPRQDTGEPGLRIDIVIFGDDDEAALKAARCPPRSEPANSQTLRPGNASESPFRSIVGQAHARDRGTRVNTAQRLSM